MLVSITGFAGAAIGAFYGIAQSVRTVRSRTTAGVSTTSWIASTTAAGLWLVYGAMQRSGPQLLANTPWFASCVLIGVYLARERRMRPVISYALPWMMLVVGFVLLSIYRSTLAIIGPVFAIGMTVPQIRNARRATDVKGVSAVAWATSVLSGLLWIAYGIGIKDVPVTASSATSTVLNVLVLMTLLQAQRRVLGSVASDGAKPTNPAAGVDPACPDRISSTC